MRPNVTIFSLDMVYNLEATGVLAVKQDKSSPIKSWVALRFDEQEIRREFVKQPIVGSIIDRDVL